MVGGIVSITDTVRDLETPTLPEGSIAE